MSFLLKGCVKCRGDLFLEGDNYGKFYSCLQCGALYDFVKPLAVDPNKQRLSSPGHQNKSGISESESLP